MKDPLMLILSLYFTKVKATLRQLTLADDSVVDIGPLKTSADLEVFESISVIPSEQVLAWDPVTQPRHEIKYRATGGVPAHNFISSNTTFATIAQTGLAKTQGMGWCNISAFVPKYPHVRGDAEVSSLPLDHSPRVGSNLILDCSSTFFPLLT